MLREIQKIKSKINFLNAQIAGFHDSGLFSPMEIAELAAPIVPQIQELQEQIIQIQAGKNEDAIEEALTPQKQYV